MEEDYNILKNKGKRILRCLSKNIEVRGLENIIDSSGIITPNHFDWKDILVVGTVIPREICFVAQEEILDEQKFSEVISEVIKEKTHLPKRLFYHISNYLARIVVSNARKIEDMLIPVSVNGGNGSFYALSEKMLSEDKLICLFPERRKKNNKHKEIQSFMLGFSKISYRMYEQGYDIPVYPVAIKNSMNYFRTIKLEILPPVYIREFLRESPQETIESFAKEVETKVRNSYSKL